MSRSGAGIRRGVMAAEQFTQIANGLFRDARLSFKAKGLFGYLSTHRDGRRMTVTDLARRGRDGEAAVKSGLKELQRYGFLLRERERNPDGTLGAAAYVITDRLMPNVVHTSVGAITAARLRAAQTYPPPWPATTTHPCGTVPCSGRPLPPPHGP